MAAGRSPVDALRERQANRIPVRPGLEARIAKRPDKTADRWKSIAAKSAYSRNAQKKLLESRSRLDGVTAKIRNAIATGKIAPGKRLELAQLAVRKNYLAAEVALEKLRKSDQQDWERHCRDVDSAWEDLSRSVKNLIARITDETN